MPNFNREKLKKGVYFKVKKDDIVGFATRVKHQVLFF